MKVSCRYQAIGDAASRERGDALVAFLRDYAERRINSRLIDARRVVPPYVVLDFGNEGLFGVQVETRFGGLGLRSREIQRVLEQAAAIDLGLGTFLLTSLFPGVRPIAAFAPEALRAELLPLLATGRCLAGYAQTEPGAGTHFPAMEARAVARGDGTWSLSGDKVWIGNATWARALTVMAHDEEDGRRRGLTAFCVDTASRGVELGRELLSLGMRGMVQAEVSFRAVEVGAERVLGERTRGLEVGVDSMSWSRFAIAATCVGAMKRCAQLALRFAGRRSIATGRLLEHPVALASLGETLARAVACERMLARVAARLDAGEGVSADVFAACKVAGSEFLWESADRLVQTLGSRGYDEANLAPQLLRDARVTRIFEGTSEALLAFLGSQALVPGSDLHGWLQGELAAADLSDALAGVAQALRRRELAGGGGLPRPWQQALAGRAAVWALVAAELRGAPPGPLPAEALREWGRLRFERACADAERGAPEEALLRPPSELEKAVALLGASVGDSEQSLPGEKLDLDPLLRREPPAGADG
jgi:alkylation response protein AidB-like acyl-CoA dehydrogenase